jgi:hypothetical protein
MAATAKNGTNERPTNVILTGAVPGSQVHISSKIDFLHGLGSALVCGERNLVADVEIYKDFTRELLGDHVIRVKSKTTGVAWDFVRDEEFYSNSNFNCLIPKDYKSLLRAEVYSFYQPRRPSNRELTKDEDKSVDDARHARCVAGPPGSKYLSK